MNSKPIVIRSYKCDRYQEIDTGVPVSVWTAIVGGWALGKGDINEYNGEWQGAAKTFIRNGTWRFVLANAAGHNPPPGVIDIVFIKRDIVSDERLTENVSAKHGTHLPAENASWPHNHW